jgi:hypothetical protein
MENFFKGFNVEYIDRNKNARANELAKAVARNTPLPVDVFFANHIRCINQKNQAGAEGY